MGGFVLIDRLTNTTVGSGMILEAGSGRAPGDGWAAEPAMRLKLRESLNRILAERTGQPLAKIQSDSEREVGGGALDEEQGGHGEHDQTGADRQ